MMTSKVSQTRIQRLKVQAMEGNDKAMMHLGVLAVNDPSLIPKAVLPVVFHHTTRTASRALQYNEPLPPTIGPLAFAAMDVLGRALIYPNELRPSKDMKARHASLILEHLEGIWIWIRHFITTVVDVPLQELDPQVYTYVHDGLENTITRLLAAIMDHEQLCFRLLTFSDFIPALARLSVHVIDPRYRHQGSSKSNIMNVFAYIQDKEPEVWRPRAAEAYRKIAHLAVPFFLQPFTGTTPFNQELFLTPEGLSELMTDLALFKNFYSTSQEITARLLKNDAARWITHFTYLASRYAHHYSRIDRPGMDVRKRATFITILFFPLEFLSHAVQSFGYTVVIQALQNNFLSAAVSCIINFVRVPKNPLPDQLMLLFDSISRYSIYLPVMKALTRRRLVMDKSALRHCLAVSRDSDEGLCRALAGFLVTIEKRTELKSTFDQSVDISMFCENNMCPQDNLSDVFHNSKTVQRCSGCRKAVYCSKQCQKYDWRHGHREQCISNTKLRKSDDSFMVFDTGQLNKHQFAFTEFIVADKFHKKRDRYIALLAEHSQSEDAHDSVEEEVPILRFDFRYSVEPRVDAVSVSECWKQLQERFDCERMLMLLRSRKVDEDPMYVFAVLPDGKELTGSAILSRIGEGEGNTSHCSDTSSDTINE